MKGNKIFVADEKKEEYRQKMVNQNEVFLTVEK